MKPKPAIPGILRLVVQLILLTALAAAGQAEEHSLSDFLPPVEVHGFVETRCGARTQSDLHEKDASVLEARFQTELFAATEALEFKFRADAWADGVGDKGRYDTRELWLFARPLEYMDLKAGRQVLTWGTGDLVFLNDLFPKDWQSFFLGRDKEYLKAPSDAVKVSLFSAPVNLDLVYTPCFDADRYVTGEFLSYWDGQQGARVGKDRIVAADKPDRWFGDEELALRLYRNIHNYELALYAYHGFWKRPAGQAADGKAVFPALNVYGASARGKVGPGIGNLELAYYDSADDRSGTDPLIDNAEMRYLAGYTQDLARDFNASVQYYVEHLLDYGAYRAALSGGHARDRLRHVITLQLTRLALNQTLTLSLSSYYSPSDADFYLMPHIHYQVNDRLGVEVGANIFQGEAAHTFFAQFEKNTNVYAAVRYSF